MAQRLKSFTIRTIFIVYSSCAIFAIYHLPCIINFISYSSKVPFIPFCHFYHFYHSSRAILSPNIANNDVNGSRHWATISKIICQACLVLNPMDFAAKVDCVDGVHLFCSSENSCASAVTVLGWLPQRSLYLGHLRSDLAPKPFSCTTHPWHAERDRASNAGHSIWIGTNSAVRESIRQIKIIELRYESAKFFVHFRRATDSGDRCFIDRWANQIFFGP